MVGEVVVVVAVFFFICCCCWPSKHDNRMQMSHRQTFAVWIQVCGDRVCVCVCVWKYVYVCMFCGLCSRCMFMSDGSCQRYNKFSYCLLMFINWKMLMPWNRRSGLKVDSHASVLSEREFSAANSKSSERKKGR